MDPVTLYCEPGRQIASFSDVDMKREFREWVSKVQDICEEHNIADHEPILVDLPKFTFSADTSLARRINRLSTPNTQELAPGLLEGDTPAANAELASAASTASTATAAPHIVVRNEEHEHVVDVPDVFNRSKSIEENFHTWARFKHAGKSIISFIRTGATYEGDTISEHFDANSVLAEDLEPLREYLIVSRDNTNNLEQRVRFMDGSERHIDTQMLFESDEAVEQSLELVRSSEHPMFVIEYCA